MELFTIFSHLDVRTIAFMVSVSALLQAVMVSFQLLLNQRYKGIGAALAGNLCSAAGFLLFSARDVLSPLFTIVLSNILIVSSVSLIYLANCLFTETRYRRWVAVLPPLLSLPFLFFYTYQVDNLVIRTAAVSLVSVLPMGLTAYILYTRAPDSYSKAARLTAFPYAVYTLMIFARGMGVFVVPPLAVFEQSPVQIASFFGIFVLGNLWTIGFILMINQRLYGDLNAAATTDYLTNLLNRRAMMDLLQTEVSRSKRNKKTFALLLIDLDHFKRVNDTYGHQVGDDVLVEVSRIFKSVIRKQDHIARWGGEEFLIAFPETALEKALVVGERLRHTVESMQFLTDQKNVYTKISISIGVAVPPNLETPLEQTLALADQGLYLAKQTRNSVKSVSGQFTETNNPIA